MQIGKYQVEYLEDTHTYLVDGIILPSITTLLKDKFDKYSEVSEKVLEGARVRGNRVHGEIEEYERNNTIVESQELTNYLKIKKKYKFEVVEVEKIVILEIDNKPVACGRLDQLININGELAINDIKSTSKLDIEYLYYQTNLYRIAHNQTYGTDIKLCYGTHLNKDVFKFQKLLTNTDIVIQLVKDYLSKRGESNVGIDL